MSKPFRIWLMGEPGLGKSALCKLLSGDPKFVSSNSALAVTQHCSSAPFNLTGVDGTLTDFPGHSNQVIEIENLVLKEIATSSDPVQLIFYCIAVGRVEEFVLKNFMALRGAIGPTSFDSLVTIMFTKSDASNPDISTAEDELNWLNGASTELKKILKICSNRFIFSSNPPTSSIPPIEERYQEMREETREKITRFLKKVKEEPREGMALSNIQNQKKEREKVEKDIQAKRYQIALDDARKRAQSQLNCNGCGFTLVSVGSGGTTIHANFIGGLQCPRCNVIVPSGSYGGITWSA